jgi:hypothetical protein
MKRFLSLVWRGWKTFAHALGVVNTKILLTLTYFIILAIVAILGRLFGADLLDKRLKHESSYWRKRKPTDVTIDSCRHQF